MTNTRALRLAIKVIQSEIKRLGPNANLHDLYHLDSAEAVNASKERKDLQEVAQLLNGMIGETKGPVIAKQPTLIKQSE
jgi:hypothetical protein